jgi:hypothetical protein
MISSTSAKSFGFSQIDQAKLPSHALGLFLRMYPHSNVIAWVIAPRKIASGINADQLGRLRSVLHNCFPLTLYGEAVKGYDQAKRFLRMLDPLKGGHP